MYKLKRRGPSIEPCGTPDSTDLSDDLVSVELKFWADVVGYGLVIEVN